MSKFRTCRAAITAVTLLAVAQPASAQVDVVVTSKPAHALVAAVMAGVGTPALLVDGTSSPHTYAMKPSDAQRVNGAKFFFRISEALEPFTARLMKSLPKSVRTVSLAEVEGIDRLARRSGGTFEAEAQGKGHAHSHVKAKVEAADTDPHVWLDPANAKAMTSAIVAALSQAAPADAAKFAANGASVAADLDRLAAELDRDLAPVSTVPFVVFHDALQYFERRFKLTAVGSITVTPDAQPSAKRLSELRKKVQSLSAVCVFSEPHFQQKVAASVTEGTRARIGMLDPEGLSLQPGQGLYAALMRKLAADMKACLSPTT